MHGVDPGLGVAFGVVFGARVGPGVGDGVVRLDRGRVVAVGFERSFALFISLGVVDGFLEPVLLFDFCTGGDAAFVFFSRSGRVGAAPDEDELLAEVGVLAGEG